MRGRKHPRHTPATRLPAAKRGGASWLAAPVAALSLVYVALVLFVMVRRAAYPYELEWLEGIALEHVQRVRHGLPLYTAPSLAWVPLNYTPLYFWLSAAASVLFGETFLAMRLVSILSALAAGGLMWKLVRHETGRASPAWLAVGLFAATYRLGGAWFDVARADSLHLALLLAGAWVARTDPSRWRMPLLAGTLFAFAFLTKQSVIVAAGPLMLWLLLTDRPRGLVLALTFAALSAGFVYALDAESGGWFGYYAYVVPRFHSTDLKLLWTFPAQDLGLRFGGVIAIGVLALLGTKFAKRAAFGFHASLALGFLGLGWSLRLYPGGYDNVLVPAHAALAMFGAFAFAALTGPGARWATFGEVAAALMVMQLALLRWDPQAQIPTTADRAAGDQLVADLRALPGRVYVSSHTYLLERAGRPTHAHVMPLMDVIRDGHGPREQALLAALRDSLGAHAWDQVVLDNRDWLLQEFARAGYRPTATLLRSGTVFWPVTGMRTRPEYLFVSPTDSAAKAQPVPGPAPSTR
jgi:hypothetical protein